MMRTTMMRTIFAIMFLRVWDGMRYYSEWKIDEAKRLQTKSLKPRNPNPSLPP